MSRQEENNTTNGGYAFVTESEAESSGAESTEEEDLEELLEKEKEKQAQEEAKVKAAAKGLGYNRRRVGDIRGKSNLYSSQYVDDHVNKLDQALDDNDWSSGVGTLRFGKHLIDDDGYGGGDMGMVLQLFDGPMDASADNFYKPKYASLRPETIKLWDDGNEREITVTINFLGDGYLELRRDGVYFAGIQVQDRKAVKREAEEVDIEWQNCKYTGHLHPANNKRLKMAWAEAGMLDDYEYSDSDSGSFDESDATEGDDASQVTDENEDEEESEEEEEEEEANETGLTRKEEVLFDKVIDWHLDQAIRYEQEARRAKASLAVKWRKNKRTPLGNIRGKWTLFSSEYLGFYDRYPNRKLALNKIMSWSAGTLTIFGDYARTGIELNLLDQPDETCIMSIKTPKFASPKSIPGEAQGSSCQYRCWLTFLGKGFLELRVRGDMLEENHRGPGKDRPTTVKYVGVLDVED